jgi:sugar lactone lactonase YvrE
VARVRAPELVGQGGWIGATPDFGLTPLVGKVVVLHFWTASCVNCIRVLEELKPIESRFAAEAVIVGVHSPKFPREHDHAAVERAVERLGIRHPVLDDPELVTWQQYNVKGWPTLVVIDPEGYVIGGISGEGTGTVVFSAVEHAVSEHEEKGTLNRGTVTGLWGPRNPARVGTQSLAFPAKVAVSPDGRRLAVTDTDGDRVIVSDLQGRVEQVYPLYTKPQGVRFDGDRLIVCDTGGDRVVAVDRRTGDQTVLAEGIASPADAIVLPDGDILVAEAGRHQLRRIPAAGGEASVVAGTGQENLLDGPTAGDQPALLAQPSGLALLPDGAVAFVDAESSSLRVLTADGRVETLVGQGLFDWGASDGGPDASAMQHPLGVATSGATSFVADTLNGAIRRWTGTDWQAEAGELTTIPTGGLEEPGGLAVLPDGRLLVADTNHHRLVTVDPDTGAVTELTLDETWLGTAAGDPVKADPGDEIRVPYLLDPEEWAVDGSAGPAVRVNVAADPPALLGPGPRSWALESPDGSVSAVGGTGGEGVLIVEVEVAVCKDTECTVLKGRTRYDLTITGPPAEAPPPPDTAEGAPDTAEGAPNTAEPPGDAEPAPQPPE